MPIEKPMLILVTGSRSVPRAWEDTVWEVLDPFKDAPYLTVMHGDCPHPGYYGASEYRYSIDTLAKEWCHENNITQWAFPAPWESELGNKAGPYRNRIMVNTYWSLVTGGLWSGHIFAFHPDLENSKGTGLTVRMAEGRGLQVTKIPAP